MRRFKPKRFLKKKRGYKKKFSKRRGQVGRIRIGYRW